MEFEFLAFRQLIILSFSVVEFSEYRLLILLFYFGQVTSIYGCFPISTKLTFTEHRNTLFTDILFVNLTTSLWGRYYHHPHFTDEEMKFEKLKWFDQGHTAVFDGAA